MARMMGPCFKPRSVIFSRGMVFSIRLNMPFRTISVFSVSVQPMCSRYFPVIIMPKMNQKGSRGIVTTQMRRRTPPLSSQ